MGSGVWHKFGLTGGGAFNLDGIDTLELIEDHDICHTIDVSDAYKYWCHVFMPLATDAHDPPLKVRPANYSARGTGVWYGSSSPYGDIQVQPEIVSGLAITGGISGGDVTVSGNTLTITPTTCLNSGLTAKLYTSANQTCVIPSTANTDYYVFLVKLAVGGTFEFRTYTTLAGVASDGDVSKYRFITWCQTNGSSVVRPFSQVGSFYIFLGTDMPRIAATLTTSLVSKTISTIIPTASGIFERIKLCATGASTSWLAVSYDGTNLVDTAAYTVNATVNSAIEIVSCASIYARYIGAGSCALDVSGVTIRR